MKAGKIIFFIATVILAIVVSMSTYYNMFLPEQKQQITEASPKDSLQGCNGKKAQEKPEVIYEEPITLIGYFSKKLDNHTYAFTVDDGRKIIIGKGI